MRGVCVIIKIIYNNNIQVLLLGPCLIAGALIGVIVNKMCASWLIVLLMIIILFYTIFITYKQIQNLNLAHPPPRPPPSPPPEGMHYYVDNKIMENLEEPFLNGGKAEKTKLILVCLLFILFMFFIYIIYLFYFIYFLFIYFIYCFYLCFN